MSANIIDHVPASLRDEVVSAETVLPPLLGPQLLAAGADMDAAIGYVQGCLDHQERIASEASKVFKGTILGVERVERRTGDFLLGVKANIVFEAEASKGGLEEQSIMTEWIEFNGYDAWKSAWSISLSRTMVAIAEANIGRECLIRKAFREAETAAGGDKVRFCADLRPTGKQGDSGGGKGGKSESRRNGGDRDFQFSPRLLSDIIEDESIDVDLNENDLRDLADILNDHQKDINKLADELADVFEVDGDDAYDALRAATGEQLAVDALKHLHKAMS